MFTETFGYQRSLVHKTIEADLDKLGAATQVGWDSYGDRYLIILVEGLKHKNHIEDALMRVPELNIPIIYVVDIRVKATNWRLG